MKRTVFLLFVIAAFLVACSSSQNITSSFVNKEAMPDKPYNKIFVVALVHDNGMRAALEDRMADLFRKRGKEVVKSTDQFEFRSDLDSLSRDEKIEGLRAAGCDAAFTITILDVQTEERYVPGAKEMQAPPYRWYYYGSYNDYTNFRYNQTKDPGYVTKEQTYFFESNFYDVASEKLLWSIQTDAFDPVDIDSWFGTYSKMIISHLKKERLIKK